MHLPTVSVLLLGFGLCLHAGEVRPKLKPSLSNTWVWENGELAPKAGGARKTWLFDGETLRPKLSHSPRDQWTWDGETLTKRFGKEDPIVWDGEELKVKGADLEKTYILKDGEWYPRAGNRSENTWIADEDVPMPILAVVLFFPEEPAE